MDLIGHFANIMNVEVPKDLSNDTGNCNIQAGTRSHL